MLTNISKYLIVGLYIATMVVIGLLKLFEVID